MRGQLGAVIEKILDHAEFIRDRATTPQHASACFPIKGANATPATTIMSFSVLQKAPFGFYLVRWGHFATK